MSSTDEFTVDLDELDNLVTRLTSLVGFLTDHLSVLDQKVATLHSGDIWQGITADAHQKAHAQWAVAAKEFVDGVAELSTAARNAHSQHSTAITANTRMFRHR